MEKQGIIEKYHDIETCKSFKVDGRGDVRGHYNRKEQKYFNSRQLQDLIGHFPVAGAGPNVPVRIGNVMNPQLIMELTEMRKGEECCYKNPFLEFSMMANSLGEIACKWHFHLSVCSLGKFEKVGNGGQSGKVSGRRRS